MGYSTFNDLTSRRAQKLTSLWILGENGDKSGPLGPLVQVRTRVNGTTVQQGSTDQMFYTVGDTLAHISRTFTIEPGDILATGLAAAARRCRRGRGRPARRPPQHHRRQPAPPHGDRGMTHTTIASESSMFLGVSRGGPKMLRILGDAGAANHCCPTTTLRNALLCRASPSGAVLGSEKAVPGETFITIMFIPTGQTALTQWSVRLGPLGRDSAMPAARYRTRRYGPSVSHEDRNVSLHTRSHRHQMKA